MLQAQNQSAPVLAVSSDAESGCWRCRAMLQGVGDAESGCWRVEWMDPRERDAQVDFDAEMVGRVEFGVNNGHRMLVEAWMSEASKLSRGQASRHAPHLETHTNAACRREARDSHQTGSATRRHAAADTHLQAARSCLAVLPVFWCLSRASRVSDFTATRFC